jgi:hypothetical protein
LIVHGTMVTLLIENPAWLQSLDKEIVMLIFFALFFLLAMLLDRRAILISTQIYVIYALSQLLQNQFSQTQNVLIYILMGLGFFVIFFGTYWYKTRSLIFGFLTNYQISRYIPDLRGDHTLKAG